MHPRVSLVSQLLASVTYSWCVICLFTGGVAGLVLCLFAKFQAWKDKRRPAEVVGGSVLFSLQLIQKMYDCVFLSLSCLARDASSWCRRGGGNAARVCFSLSLSTSFLPFLHTIIPVGITLA